MYDHVIVGVDGKAGGRDAAALSSILASTGASVSLVYVSTSGPDASVDETLADEGALVEILESELELCGGDAQLVRMAALSVGSGLEQVAQEREADLIVVGASHRRGISRLVAGDHVKSVIHQTPCAVAVAPAGFAEHAGIVARVGVAYDGSPESEVALAHAGLLAAQRHRELIVRHLVEPHFYCTGMVAVPIDDRDSELVAARERLGHPDGLEVEHVCGTAREGLLEFSRTVDLLVCGSRRNSLVRRIAVGSTSENLARHVQVPLVIAPPLDSASVEQWRAQRQATTA